MLCWGSIVSCAESKGREVPASAATLQCQVDCVSVSKALVKEHYDLFDENIRLKAALAICERRR